MKPACRQASENLALPVRTRGLSGGRSAPAEGGSASGGSESFPLTTIDARVFSLFEGAEEVLALRVIARQLLDETLKKGS